MVKPVLALLTLVLTFGSPAQAADTERQQKNPDVDAIVPVDPYEHERLHFFDGRDHHVVPNTVTINRKPYVCDVDGRRFRDRDSFVAHIRRTHQIASDALAGHLLVEDGLVHFVGKPLK